VLEHAVSTPSLSSDVRRSVLEQLAQGELSVESALEKLKGNEPAPAR
jgi:hypothetical protein